MSIPELSRNNWVQVDDLKNECQKKYKALDIRISTLVGHFFMTSAAISGIAFAATGHPVLLASFIICLVSATISYLSDEIGKSSSNFFYHRRTHTPVTPIPTPGPRVIPVPEPRHPVGIQPQVIPVPVRVAVPVEPLSRDPSFFPATFIAPNRQPSPDHVRHPVGVQPHIVPVAVPVQPVRQDPPIIPAPFTPPPRPASPDYVQRPVGVQTHAVPQPRIPVGQPAPERHPVGIQNPPRHAPAPSVNHKSNKKHKNPREEVRGQPQTAPAAQARHQVGGSQPPSAPQNQVRHPVGGTHAGRHVVGGNRK